MPSRMVMARAGARVPRATLSCRARPALICAPESRPKVILRPNGHSFPGTAPLAPKDSQAKLVRPLPLGTICPPFQARFAGGQLPLERPCRPDKDSDKRQRAVIAAFAKAHGYAIVDEFYAAAVSGADPIAESVKAMLDRVAGNGVRCIVVESPIALPAI